MKFRASVLLTSAIVCFGIEFCRPAWGGFEFEAACAKNNSWQVPQGIRAVTAAYCAKSQGEALSWSKEQGIGNWTACPREASYSPLGNLHPLKAVVLGFRRLVDSSEPDNLEFLAQMSRLIHKHHPQTPINIVISGDLLQYAEIRDRISAYFGQPPLSEIVGFQPTGSSENIWMRDLMTHGVRGVPPRNILQPMQHRNRDAVKAAKDLAHACGLEAGDDVPRIKGKASSDVGGNIMGFPGGITAIGNTMRPDARKSLFLNEDAGRTDGEPVAEVKTDWLAVGHVDEILSVVPTSNHPSPCNFAITYASPRLGVDVLRRAFTRSPDRAVDPRSPSWGPMPASPMDVRKDSSLFPCILALNIKRDSNESLSARDLTSCPELERANLGYEEAILKEVRRIQSKVASKTGCAAPPIVAVPQLFLPSTTQPQYPSASPPIDQARALNPNAVNAMVLGKTVVAPAQSHAAFAEAINNTYLKLGLSIESADTGFYHRLDGEIHCATNELRTCSP